MMLGKFVSKNEPNINKGKGNKKERQKNFPKHNLFQKGVDGHKAEKKYELLKGKTKGKKEKKTEKEEKKDFKDRPFGGTKWEKRTLKLQRINFLGLSTKQKNKNTEKIENKSTNSPPPQKKKQKNTLWHVCKQPPFW